MQNPQMNCKQDEIKGEEGKTAAAAASLEAHFAVA
jgi:hypothetical protein